MTIRWCPSTWKPHGSFAEGSPITVTWYSHSPYCSKSFWFISPSVWLSRMMSRDSFRPFALSAARISPNAASRCASLISRKLTPCRT